MDFSKYFDHTNLKPEATKQDIEKLCAEAVQYGFASVCVNTCYTSLVKRCLENSDVKTCVVVGFPLGAMDTKSKAFETKVAVENGADEIDMVINVGALKEKDYDYVLNDIKAVRNACVGKTLKVILENCFLTDEEKKVACKLCVEAEADFVKTSTGFSKGGATVEDVKLMKMCVDGKAKVKAAGAIRDKNTATAMIEAGADRLGTSATMAIMGE